MTHGNFSEFVRTVDISVGGARFRTTQDLSSGDMLDLNVHLSLFPQSINVKARVVRVYDPSGDDGDTDIGVEFLGMSASDREKLKESTKLLGDSPGKES